jgi:hypothetical protein
VGDDGHKADHTQSRGILLSVPTLLVATIVFKRTCFLVMRSQLALVSEHFSEQIAGADGRPVDLSDTVLPPDTDTPAADRLIDAIAEARRELRIRLRATPAGADAPLRLGLISTTEAGTGMEIETASLPVQNLDFQSDTDRERILDGLHALERSMLSS